jgi:hypothetical protein
VNTIELGRALKQLRLSGMADVLDTRLVQAQAERLVHLDFLSVLVGDEHGQKIEVHGHPW